MREHGDRIGIGEGGRGQERREEKWEWRRIKHVMFFEAGMCSHIPHIKIMYEKNYLM